MATRATPRLIGGFIVGGIALAIAGIVVFGGTRFLASKQTAVLFFQNASLSGLDVGAPVTFRGVRIGSVTGLVMHYDVDRQTLQIPVTVELELDRIQITGGHHDVRNIQALVDRGLRGQLALQSLVTGQLSIEFNFHPGTPVTLVGAAPGMLELPTIPSDIDLLKANVTSVLQSLAKLPLDDIASELRATVRTANGVLADLGAHIQPLTEDLRRVSAQAILTLKEAQSRLELREGEPLRNLNEALTGAQRLVKDADQDLAPLAAGADKLMKTAIGALEQAQRTLQAAQQAISPDSTLVFQLNRTLREIQSMATSIRTFADYMQHHPESLLTGKR
jgi:paraquat-inducible protein B